MRRGEPRPDFATLELDRARRSDTYRALSPGTERALALALWAHVSQYGPILDEDPEISIAGCGAPASLVRELLPRADFYKSGRSWRNRNAETYFRSAINSIEKFRKAGRARQAQIRAKASEGKDDRESASLSASLQATHYSSSSSSSVIEDTLLSKREKEGTGNYSLEQETVGSQGIAGSQEELHLVPLEAPIHIEAPRREKSLDDITKLYLSARAARKWGTEEGARAGTVSDGTFEKVKRRIEKRMDEGFDWRLIVAAPVSVSDRALFMLGDPMTLLIDGSKPRTTKGGYTAGAVDHLSKLDSMLSETVFGKRQRDILRNLGVYDYVKGRGAKASDGGWE